MSTSRRIIVYATRGGNGDKKKNSLITSATTWGQIKEDIINLGFDLSNLLATESVTNNDLVNDLAILPKEDFVIFLRPRETKSGLDGSSMSYITLKHAISDLMETHGEYAKQHFNEDRNYTTKSTDELRRLYDNFIPEEVMFSEEDEFIEGEDTIAMREEDPIDALFREFKTRLKEIVCTSYSKSDENTSEEEIDEELLELERMARRLGY
jgi:hypothetical protein